MKRSIVGKHYKTQKTVDVNIDGGQISDIQPLDRETNLWISPGLVDLQINGFDGIDFNEENTGFEEIQKVTKAIWKTGVTTFFPTIITNSDTQISLAIQQITNACHDKHIDQSLAGIHLEGPFISKENGPRGAHPMVYVKAPDWELFCRWQDEAEGRIKLITLSPEWPESDAFIRKCTQSGVKVAIGHTAASPSQIRGAIAAGATLSTHLGNASHALLPRHENYIWEQLASTELWSTIIADGFHLPDAMLKIFLKVKPQQTLLVSDATKFAGMKPGSFHSHIGGAVELDADGRLFPKDSPGMLAGSAKSLLACIEYLSNSKITSLDKAIEMASLKPMEAMGMDTKLHGLVAGQKADLIVFEKLEKKIKVIQTIKSGEIVFQST